MAQIQVKVLTEDERVNSLCRLYWEVDNEHNFMHTVSSLAQQFGILSRDLTRLVKQSCKAFSIEDICPRCETPHPYTSRSDYQRRVRYTSRGQLCSDCIATENEIKKAQRLAEFEEQRRIVRERFSLRSHELIDVNELTFEDAVYLLGFIRSLASEDFSGYRPLNSSTTPLSPREEYSIEIVRQLFSKGLIAIHPDTPPEVFTFENSEPVRMYLDRVHWALASGCDTNDTHLLISQLERTFREKEWPTDWQEEYLPLWKKVALQECLEYLEFVLNEHKLPFSPGEKTLSVLTNLLEDHSVSEIYSIIWTAGKGSAAFYLREKVTKQHAANSVVGRMQRYADRARAEGWNIKPFRRNWRCPQSVISQLLFDTALQIGERGFSEPPHIID